VVAQAVTVVEVAVVVEEAVEEEMEVEVMDGAALLNGSGGSMIYGLRSVEAVADAGIGRGGEGL
jgi:hypothetical protein